ncbi:MAG: hypothetical protein M3539_16410, partial [Acidobacteriota bacterium]|nr:hypothetical protein [Acidobacteriota bacterium]
TEDGTHRIVYRGDDNDIHSLNWKPDEVGITHENLSAGGAAVAQKAAGDPAAYFIPKHVSATSGQEVQSRNQVTYRGTDSHIYELWWHGEDAVRYWDLSNECHAPLAASDPVAYYSGGVKHVYYLGGDGSMHWIWWVLGQEIPLCANLTLLASAPLAVGKPSAFAIENPPRYHVVYMEKDEPHHIHEINWNVIEVPYFDSPTQQSNIRIRDGAGKISPPQEK